MRAEETLDKEQTHNRKGRVFFFLASVCSMVRPGRPSFLDGRPNENRDTLRWIYYVVGDGTTKSTELQIGIQPQKTFPTIVRIIPLHFGSKQLVTIATVNFPA